MRKKNFFFFIYLFSSIFFILSQFSLPCFGLELTLDGKPVASIIIENPGKSVGNINAFPSGSKERWAADIVAEWIQKISGARLPVLKTALGKEPVIYIGQAAIKQGLDLSHIKSSGNEGFKIVTDGNRILIAGQNSISTVKAACRFLEELGCRYFMDNHLGEVYPKTSTLKVGKLNISGKPGFLYRRIWGSNWGWPTLWKVWNGDGGQGLDMAHAWNRYVPATLYKTHPEYFRFASKKRWKGDWYCTSNPDLQKIFSKNVIKQIQSGNMHPSISPPDGNGYCQCETCRALDDPDSKSPSSGRVNMTNRYLDFYQSVAAPVKKEYPNSILNFYCYADYTQPPTSGIKLNSNLCAWLAPIRYCRFHSIGTKHCPSRFQLKNMIDKWNQSVEKIGYRTYNYNLAECLVPFSKISIWKNDMPYLKSKGCVGVSLETLTNWQIYGPHIYLSIRLAYDPDADADTIMDDYFVKFYGPDAGPSMKKYWMSVDNKFINLKSHAGSFYSLHLVYTTQFIEECKKLISKAKKLAGKNSSYLTRIEMAEEGLKNAVEYLAIRDAFNRGDILNAGKTYEKLLSRSERHSNTRLGNHYTVNYLKIFIGRHIKAAQKATASPNELLQILPDKWYFKYDETNTGRARYYRKDFDLSSWKKVKTYSDTLDAQSWPDKKTIMWYVSSLDLPQKEKGRFFLLFLEVDGVSELYVNGRQVGKNLRSRHPFKVDITDVIEKGRNRISLRVDHSRITELFLGGIIRPVLLIRKNAS